MGSRQQVKDKVFRFLLPAGLPTGFMVLDLSNLPLIDHHCHPFWPLDRPLIAEQFNRIFTESDDPRILKDFIADTLYYQQAIRELSRFLSCENSLEAVLEKRNALPDKENYLNRLITDAGIRVMLIDYGFLSEGYSLDTLRTLLPCKVKPVLRLEKLMENLLLETESFGDFMDRFLVEMIRFKDNGGVAFKSIIAYRSGLEIKEVSQDPVIEEYRILKEKARKTGSVRITSKPFLDYIIWTALEKNAEINLPIQFHTGFGDSDLDLLQANPLLLKNIFKNKKFQNIPIILLHTGYPYTREAGYLANLYANIYVDLSLAIPLLHHRMTSVLNDLFSLTPLSKILYGSDAHSFPEFYWLGARIGRQVLGTFLDQMIQSGTLSHDEALGIAEGILYKNAEALYGLREDQ